MTPWDAARWRQRWYTPPRVVKMHGPVGEAACVSDDSTCRCHGVHRCPFPYPVMPEIERGQRGPLATHAPVHGYWPPTGYCAGCDGTVEPGGGIVCRTCIGKASMAVMPVMLTVPYRTYLMTGIGREVPPEPMTPCSEAFSVAYDELKHLARVLPADRAMAIALLTTGACPACAHCNQPDDMPHVDGCPGIASAFKRPWGKYLADQEND
jgi:hypothetical protein